MQVLDALSIDLDGRLRANRFLELGEIEEIGRMCRLRADSLDPDGYKVFDEACHVPKVVRLERSRVRLPLQTEITEVSPETTGIRLHYIISYLRWLSNKHLLAKDTRNPEFPFFQSVVNGGISALAARVPSKGSRNTVEKRMGLTKESLIQLQSVIEPSSPDNPWKNEHIRYRNRVLIYWMLSLGLRRGEALNVQVSDINSRTFEVMIARRADDPLDSRKDQPVVKTLDRLLQMTDSLANLTMEYTSKFRRQIRGAQSHPFLFVSTGTGKPLSLPSVNAIFNQLRTKCPDLPDELTAHVLRHTWNELFSESADKAGLSDEQEQKARSYQMGWREGGRSAADYTRRGIKRKSQEISAEMQAGLLKANYSK